MSLEELANIPPSNKVGLVDRHREGWYNNKNGEVAPGVFVSPEETVIDIGCGDGAMINFCASRGAEVLFADRDAERVAFTEDKVKAQEPRAYQAIVSDCDPIPIEDGRGDLVMCTEVLEHVPDPAVFLNELIRITRPGGRLLLTVPDSRSEEFVKVTAPPAYFKEPNHIRIFTKDEFRELVQDAGLSIEKHGFSGAFWSVYWPLSWLTCEPGGGLPFNNQHPMCLAWTKVWSEVQKHPNGHLIRDALNELLPKSQWILAHKPG